MKAIKTYSTTFTFFLLLATTTHAQQTISGTIANYSNEPGTVTSFDLITRESLVLGKIDKDGSLTIPLDENYLKNVLNRAEETENISSDGGAMTLYTVAKFFEWLAKDLVYSNGDAVLSLPQDFNLKDATGTTYGVLYAVSKPDVAKWLSSYGSENTCIGYYLQWVIVDDAASAIGGSSITVDTGIDDETYNYSTLVNLNFQKGWNIIKYNITETYKDKNGKLLASKMELTSLNTIPEDVEWCVVNLN